MNNGYIKTHRKFTEWEWYTNVNVKTLFIHCLLKANFKDKKYQGIDIKRGQFMTSINKLHIETGLSERQVRSALDKLILTNELTNKSNNKYRTITVINYNKYQTLDKQDDKPLTSERQASDKQVTTTNKDKKEKNDNKVLKKDTKKKPILKTKYLDFVLLSDEEYSKLQKQFNSRLDSHIENLNNYIGSKGTKYKSHYHTILSWNRRNEKENKNDNDKSLDEVLGINGYEKRSD